jgi:hypothetical protein
MARAANTDVWLQEEPQGNTKYWQVDVRATDLSVFPPPLTIKLRKGSSTQSWYKGLAIQASFVSNKGYKIDVDSSVVSCTGDDLWIRIKLPCMPAAAFVDGKILVFKGPSRF